MKCPKCHAEVGAEDRFCPNCKEKLAGTAKGANVSEKAPDADVTLLHDEPKTEGKINFGDLLASVLAERLSVKDPEDRIARHEAGVFTSPIGKSLDGKGTPFSDEILNDKINGKMGRLKETSSFKSSSAKSGMDGMSFEVKMIPKEDFSDCDCLQVEYNYNTFSIAGIHNTLKFRLTPLATHRGEESIFNLRQVRFFYYWKMEDPSQEAMKEVTEVKRKICKKNKFFDCSIPSFHNDAGVYTLVFQVECMTDDGRRAYTSQVDHLVYGNDRDADSPPITVYATGQHAADVSVNIEAMKSGCLTVNEFLNKLNKMPPAFGIKRLDEIWLDELPVGNYGPRILLRIGGYSLYVIGKTEVKMGRCENAKRKGHDGKVFVVSNDLLVRIPGLKAEQSPNNTVSSCHGVLSIQGEDITYMDTSTHGTRFDGKGDWLVKESRKMPNDHPTVVRFGDISLEMEPFLSSKALQSELCDKLGVADGAVCAILCGKIKFLMNTENGKSAWRSVKEPESYLIVPYYCSLGDVLPSADGWTLYCHNDCFGVQTPDKQYHPLDRDGRITFGGVTMEVREFKQL